jgi:general secretion pathway protein H
LDRTLSSGGQSGLTLVELLVVMTILALIAGIALINAPPARSSAREEAERFAARVRAASEDALVRGRPIAVDIDAAGYSVRRHEDGEWRPDEGDRFVSRQFPRNVAVEATMHDPALENAALPSAAKRSEEPVRIVFDVVGASAPFEVEFSDGRGRVEVAYTAEGLLRVSRNDRE